MAPKYQQLSEKLLDVVFLKLDCNQENKVCSCHVMWFTIAWLKTPVSFLCGVSFNCWQPLAKELGIKVVPTFKILKDSKIVKEVTGAKFDDLVLAIETVRSS
jgi:thioredoxin 1